jgi:hypothetical protein
VFTYHSPGDLLPGTGMKKHSGRADYTVYSKIRFPMADAPAFANSQSFMHWGNCDQTGRASMGREWGATVYRCRVNNKTLYSDESADENYSYPWRDNFCEHRYFWIGECPAGLGHQGQDIRPAFCKQRVEGAHRCEPYLHDVVAVRDGMVLRSRGQKALYIFANAPNERVRFRYLHMSPDQFDDDEFFSGRRVRQGEVIGKVGSWGRHERDTTYHLHFDMQVPTKYGWVFVNPYMTLVTAYERLIHGRGTEIRDGRPVVSAKDTDDAEASAPGSLVRPDAADISASPSATAVQAAGDTARSSAGAPPPTPKPVGIDDQSPAGEVDETADTGARPPGTD